MLALALDGYALAAIVIIAVFVLVFLILLLRTMRGDSRIRVARLGVFIERERIADDDLYIPPDEEKTDA